MVFRFNCTTPQKRKHVVCPGRPPSKKKPELEPAARREGMSLSALLNRITGEWLAERRNARALDEPEQAAIRKRVMKAIASIAGADPTRSQRPTDLIPETLPKNPPTQSPPLPPPSTP